MPHPLIAPSILSADFLNLGRDLERLNAVADWIHCDVMDGAFVPNISFGIPVIEALRRQTELPLDVHLMIESPERYIAAFVNAGADILTVHQEACVHLDRTLNAIREAGAQAGVSLNPATPVQTLQHVATTCDLVLVMSVNPGFGGQSFLPYAITKIRQLVALRHETGATFRIEVDGGITDATAPSVVAAGADVLVSGSYLFKAADLGEATKRLRESNNPPTKAV
jgi:ribulose-phosphate 3-epimerase